MNYLKALKENRIDKEDLFFSSISLEFDSSKINKIAKKYNYKLEEVQVIPDGKSNELILEAMKNYINLINPTFYQIKIFINVLGFQLIKFSQNYFLSAFNILGAKSLYVKLISGTNFINILSI